MRRWITAVFSLMFSLHVCADVAIKRIEYKVDGQPFVGSLVSDRGAAGRRPGVLLAEEKGAGTGDARAKAAHLARLGYVVLIVDLYGKDVTPKDAADAAHLAGLDEPSHAQIRARADAALQTLLKQAGVDRKQIAAVGYGIGGTAMIELARTGVDLEGVVDLHGPILPPLPDDKAPIQPTFLILIGENDPQTPMREIDAFSAEMKKRKGDVKVLVAKGETHEPSAASNKQWEARIEAYLAEEIPLKTVVDGKGKSVTAAPAGVPEKALAVLKYVDEHNEAMDNYEGGRTFGNYEHRLPANDRSGARVKYREWDVNPLRQGVNRGVERLITGSDGTAWYTNDHYETFKKLR